MEYETKEIEPMPTMEHEVAELDSMLNEYEKSVGGWYRNSTVGLCENTRDLVDTLMDKIKSDAERISRLHTKLGLLVERGP